MSRHKLVKNLDLEDELDDYDGGEDYDNDGEDAEGQDKLWGKTGVILADSFLLQNLVRKTKVKSSSMQCVVVLTQYLEHMRVGTLEVWARLPDGSAHITEKEIHEALWHYYYDIDKTVGYLVTTYISKAKKEQKKGTVGKKATGGFLLSLKSMDMVPEPENQSSLGWTRGGLFLMTLSYFFFLDFKLIDYVKRY